MCTVDGTEGSLGSSPAIHFYTLVCTCIFIIKDNSVVKCTCLIYHKFIAENIIILSLLASSSIYL